MTLVRFFGPVVSAEPILLYARVGFRVTNRHPKPVFVFLSFKVKGFKMHVTKHLTTIVLSLGIVAQLSGCDCFPRRGSCQCAQQCCNECCQPSSEPESGVPAQEKSEKETAPPPPVEERNTTAEKLTPVPETQPFPDTMEPTVEEPAATGEEYDETFWGEIDEAIDH